MESLSTLEFFAQMFRFIFEVFKFIMATPIVVWVAFFVVVVSTWHFGGWVNNKTQRRNGDA